MASDSQITDPGRGLSIPRRSCTPGRARGVGRQRVAGGALRHRTDLQRRSRRRHRGQEHRARPSGQGGTCVQVPLRELHLRGAGAGNRGHPGHLSARRRLFRGRSVHHRPRPERPDRSPRGDRISGCRQWRPDGSAGTRVARALPDARAGHQLRVVAALRVLDALDASSPSVGGPMDICRITPDGADHLSPTEVEDVRRQVGRWVELEHRALDQLFD